MPEIPTTPVPPDALTNALNSAHAASRDQKAGTITNQDNKKILLASAAACDTTPRRNGGVVAASPHHPRTIAEAKDAWRNEGNPN